MSQSECLGVVVNVEAELVYWRNIYPRQPFHGAHVDFSDYIPTLKFAYDAYLWFYRQELEQMMPELRRRYDQRVASHQRLDWERACQVISAVWKRLGIDTGQDAAPAQLRTSYLRAS